MFHRIRDLREDHDLSQTQIAQLLNVSQRCYSHYECGSRDIPTTILISLADIFDVSIDYMLNRTDNPCVNVLPTCKKVIY